MFELTMHPASEGDALVLSWGADDNPHHAVIDLGRTKDYRALRPWLKQASNVELFVMSHIDGDHIFGAMPMVREDTPPFSPGDVWFNGYHHLVIAKDNANQLEALAPGQGEKLSDGIKKFDWPWNNAFHGSPVSIDRRS